MENAVFASRSRSEVQVEPRPLSKYPIPVTALDDRLAWIGTSGSGKTYNASGGVECLLGAGARCVIVDPLGVWWGLRLKADGTPSKHSVVIFGGDHGDLPLNENAGALLGETVANMAESCIVDLSKLATKSAERRFMLAFLDAIYRSTDPRKIDPYHVIFDEADLWAPQKSSEPLLQSRMEEIVRRGRIRGFIPWLITQRPAVLSKDVLSQADGLVTFKLTASQDRKAIGDWVKAQADEGQWSRIDAALPAMQRGEGVVWVPGRCILETTQFPLKGTFDSSRTPTRGERVERRDLKPLNLESLKGKLAAIEEEQKANDPKALKVEVQRLKRELAKAEKAKAPQPAPIFALPDQDTDAARAEGVAEGLRQVMEAVAALAGGKVPAMRAARSAASFERVPAERMNVTAGDGLNGPQQRVLNSLAWWKAFGIDHPSSEQVAFIAGYSPVGGAYGNPRSALKSMGLIDYPSPGKIVLTDAGLERAYAPDAPTTRDELHRRVLGKLNGPQQRLLNPLLEAHPDALSIDDLAAKAGYSPIGGAFGNPRSSLKSLSLIEYPERGHVRAADWLFP